jgi:hypothetical protein
VVIDAVIRMSMVIPGRSSPVARPGFYAG